MKNLLKYNNQGTAITSQLMIDKIMAKKILKEWFSIFDIKGIVNHTSKMKISLFIRLIINARHLNNFINFSLDSPFKNKVRQPLHVKLFIVSKYNWKQTRYNPSITVPLGIQAQESTWAIHLQ